MGTVWMYDAIVYLSKQSAMDLSKLEWQEWQGVDKHSRSKLQLGIDLTTASR
jgi:hypothetical protein